jgi:hypothetical protein
MAAACRSVGFVVCLLLAACGSSADDQIGVGQSAVDGDGGDSGQVDGSGQTDDRGQADGSGDSDGGSPAGDPSSGPGADVPRDNDEGSLSQAVAAAKAADLNFNFTIPVGAAEETCAKIDAAVLSEIVGIDLSVNPEPHPLPTSDLHLSCILDDVQGRELAYLHFTSDLAQAKINEENGQFWSDGAMGTLEGAFPIDGLGDTAMWSDGSRGDNLTNKSLIQTFIEVDNQEIWMQGWATRLLSDEHAHDWSVAEMLWAMSFAAGEVSG